MYLGNKICVYRLYITFMTFCLSNHFSAQIIFRLLSYVYKWQQINLVLKLIAEWCKKFQTFLGPTFNPNSPWLCRKFTSSYKVFSRQYRKYDNIFYWIIRLSHSALFYSNCIKNLYYKTNFRVEITIMLFYVTTHLIVRDQVLCLDLC